MDGRLTPGLLLRAYASGIFAMAESADDPELHWVDPSRRGIIPVNGFHISRSLAREIRGARFKSTFDAEFTQVVAGCAARPDTWINRSIYELYNSLHARGYAHSQEVWDGDELAGGVYGVALGGAFFAESMFSLRSNASKVALAFLIDRLRRTGFVLFDTQFLTDHLKSLGGVEISRAEYLARLEQALAVPANIRALDPLQSPEDVLQRNGQTS